MLCFYIELLAGNVIHQVRLGVQKHYFFINYCFHFSMCLVIEYQLHICFLDIFTGWVQEALVVVFMEALLHGIWVAMSMEQIHLPGRWRRKTFGQK